ncbi:CCA tRNA nucleotidyltransferase [Synechococcus sp. CC9311]|uniref:CCA tRNA nucleotidyltransferase n=1 Tax=Synechococcus sp. (strain CC9311) TaxID=64471 RepID=UPI0000DDB2FF|nr:CCA tRNA nucleotidyltransferase [Synechococcus sp. CC9311]ABI47242.1 polyA polymerase family protein [Synechococcus sp. CC9311]
MARQLMTRLQPQRWPIPLDRLPVGTVLVGGAVRDGLLNRLPEHPDLDMVVPADALGQVRKLSQEFGGSCVVLDRDRDMARLVLGRWTIDLARQEGDALTADLMRRDYRINAIALTLTTEPKLVDPSGGIPDLRDQRITAIHEQNLLDDPLRLLRAIRLSSELSMTIDQGTLEMIARHRHQLPKVAPERIQAELLKLVQANNADQAIHLLHSLKLIAPWSSNQPQKTFNARALTAEEQQLALPLARLTQLLSDQGVNDLRFSRKQIQRCLRLRAWWKRDQQQSASTLSERERLKLHEELEEDLPAFTLAWPVERQNEWLRRWRDQDDMLFHPCTPLNGRTLQAELGLRPGPRLGELIQHLCLERAFGRIRSQDEAIQCARAWMNKPL